MKHDTRNHRIITAVLFVCLAAGAVTAPALADHRDGGKKHRRGGDRQVDRSAYEPSYVSVRATWGQGDCGIRAGRYFEDPWTGDRYTSLSDYRSRCLGHWPIARVIDARTGACERTVCWHDGAWHDYDASDPPWAHRDHRGGWRGGHRSDYGDRDD